MATTLVSTGITFPDNTTQTTAAVAAAGTLKAWVNFNGTGTVAIRASGNVSSITDNGTGAYTINFTASLSDGNYSVLLTAQAWRQTAYNDCGTLNGTVEDGTTPAIGSVRTTWGAYNESNRDPTYAYAAIFR